MCGRATFWFWVIAAVPFYFATWEQYVLLLKQHYTTFILIDEILLLFIVHFAL